MGTGPMEHSMQGRELWDMRLGGQQHLRGCRAWVRLTLLALGWWELVYRAKGPLGGSVERTRAWETGELVLQSSRRGRGTQGWSRGS